MTTEISFCPLCAGKLDSGDDEQFICEDCESHFLIQLVDDDDDDEDEDDEEEDDDLDDEEDAEDEEDEDESY